MKKILLAGFIFLLAATGVYAQTATFKVTQDTVYTIVGGTASIHDDITDLNYSTGLVVKWSVKASNFPADWLTASSFGICDNNFCRYNTGDSILWNPLAFAGPSYSSNSFSPYKIDTAGPFYLSMNLTSATTLGSYWITVNLKDTISGYSKNVTFVINKVPAAVPTVNTVTNDVSLYPNPANNEINVVYDASADVKNIAVYNIIGKVMSVYKVSNSGANLNIENMPSGIYFVRLYSSVGNVVATKKFTKQ